MISFELKVSDRAEVIENFIIFLIDKTIPKTTKLKLFDKKFQLNYDKILFFVRKVNKFFIRVD